MDLREIVATAFHHNLGEPRNWNAEPETLELLAELAGAGMTTVETGAGASTVVLASAGCQHMAISPHPREHETIRAYCHEKEIDTSRLELIAKRSEDVVPHLAGPLDLAFVDGAHTFPHPVLDSYYLARALKVGGVLVLDDVPIPAVGVMYRHFVADPRWELEALAGDRAAALRKQEDVPLGDPWRTQAFNRGYPDYGWLPLRSRTHRRLQHRRRQLRRVAGRLRRRGPL